MEKKLAVGVFCAASPKVDRKYLDAAFETGRLLGMKGFRTVTGGGSMGLMASVEEGALSVGGEVTAFIPRFMIDAGWLHPSLTDVVATETMQQRKQLMFDISDAIITLPGGCGTLDELFEVVTSKQLGLLNCPLVILNTDGFYDHLLRHLDRVADEGFMRPCDVELWSVAGSPEEAVSSMMLKLK
ncbi:MAG: TIGR00730 family Rossman fold protein [Bacteroidaceae bacterium]|nr:TIGR00730 family Rossman fold protein [Bacteroidaceae bacterium]